MRVGTLLDQQAVLQRKAAGVQRDGFGRKLEQAGVRSVSKLLLRICVFLES